MVRAGNMMSNCSGIFRPEKPVMRFTKFLAESRDPGNDKQTTLGVAQLDPYSYHFTKFLLQITPPTSPAPHLSSVMV